MLCFQYHPIVSRRSFVCFYADAKDYNVSTPTLHGLTSRWMSQFERHAACPCMFALSWITPSVMDIRHSLIHASVLAWFRGAHAWRGRSCDVIHCPEFGLSRRLHNEDGWDFQLDQYFQLHQNVFNNDMNVCLSFNFSTCDMNVIPLIFCQLKWSIITQSWAHMVALWCALTGISAHTPPSESFRTKLSSSGNITRPMFWTPYLFFVWADYLDILQYLTTKYWEYIL